MGTCIMKCILQVTRQYWYISTFSLQYDTWSISCRKKNRLCAYVNSKTSQDPCTKSPCVQ